MAHTQDRIKLIVTIVGHGQSRAAIRLYEKNHVHFHYRSLGRGTASSELLDVLGFGGTEREVIYSLAAGSVADRLIEKMKNENEETFRAKGIAFMMPLNAISNIPGIPLLRQGAQENKKYDFDNDRISGWNQ